MTIQLEHSGWEKLELNLKIFKENERKPSIISARDTKYDKDEIIQMALSDDVSFSSIKRRFGLTEHEVKKLMRKNISPRATKMEKKSSKFSDRREF